MLKISKLDSFRIAEKIKKDFFNPRANYKTSIFLCGADIKDKSKIRYKISDFLNSWRYTHFFDLIYPEDIFDELLYSSHGKDLLSLENILANSIDIILIIPESPGSFAELGAFANDLMLRKKIICLVDEKYKKHKSFINQGPIKLIKQQNRNAVIYVDPQNLLKSLTNIISAINEVKKNQPKVQIISKINLLQLDAFLLPTIYLLEPIKKDDLKNCLEAVIDDSINLQQIASTALNMLTKKKLIELNSEGFYKLTKLGKQNYVGLKRLNERIKIQNKTVDLDNTRLEILNLQLRDKKLNL